MRESTKGSRLRLKKRDKKERLKCPTRWEGLVIGPIRENGTQTCQPRSKVTAKKENGTELLRGGKPFASSGGGLKGGTSWSVDAGTEQEGESKGGKKNVRFTKSRLKENPKYSSQTSKKENAKGLPKEVLYKGREKKQGEKEKKKNKDGPPVRLRAKRLSCQKKS